MKYASIYLKFDSAILRDIELILVSIAADLPIKPNTYRFVFINGNPKCVMCLTGQPNSLRLICIVLERFFVSSRATKALIDNSDESLITATVYTETGYPAKTVKWQASCKHLSQMALEALLD